MPTWMWRHSCQREGLPSASRSNSLTLVIVNYHPWRFKLLSKQLSCKFPINYDVDKTKLGRGAIMRFDVGQKEKCWFPVNSGIGRQAGEAAHASRYPSYPIRSRTLAVNAFNSSDLGPWLTHIETRRVAPRTTQLARTTQDNTTEQR